MGLFSSFQATFPCGTLLQKVSGYYTEHHASSFFFLTLLVKDLSLPSSSNMVQFPSERLKADYESSHYPSIGEQGNPFSCLPPHGSSKLAAKQWRLQRCRTQQTNDEVEIPEVPPRSPFPARADLRTVLKRTCYVLTREIGLDSLVLAYRNRENLSWLWRHHLT